MEEGGAAWGMVELGWGVLGVTCGVCLVYQVRAVAMAGLTPQKADKVGPSSSSSSGVLREGGNRGRVRPASGEGGRNAPLQGCLGSRPDPEIWLSPRSQPPRPPIRPLFPPSRNTVNLSVQNPF